LSCLFLIHLLQQKYHTNDRALSHTFGTTKNPNRRPSLLVLHCLIQLLWQKDQTKDCALSHKFVMIKRSEHFFVTLCVSVSDSYKGLPLSVINRLLTHYLTYSFTHSQWLYTRKSTGPPQLDISRHCLGLGMKRNLMIDIPKRREVLRESTLLKICMRLSRE
jgi:hypothetical protein